MKRETKRWLLVETEGYGDTHMNAAPRDALDSDARLRAELRRKDKALRELLLGIQAHGIIDLCDIARLALKKPSARKKS